MSDLIRRNQVRKRLLARAWRDRADLYAATVSKDSKGAPALTWPATPTVARIKGALQTSWGYERKSADATSSIVTHVFMCEWTVRRLAAKDKLLIAGRWYDIEVVDDTSFVNIYQELQLVSRS